MSEINSAVDIAGINSVAPLDFTIEKLVTPLEYKY